MIKPEWVSWDAIHECEKKAHQVNNDKGYYMKIQDTSGEDLKEYIGDGVCFVALDGNDVVGVVALKYRHINRWWTDGKPIFWSCLSAVLPEYRGSVNLDLEMMKNKYFKESDIDIMAFGTAEANTLVQKMALRSGSRYVQYSASGKGSSHYSVVMARWKNGCPYSDWYCNFMFKLSKLIVRALWKPGYRWRFLPNK